MKLVQKGFTLIELMVVIAIIGVLASVAIPAYQDYTGKAQFTEGVTQAASLKQAVVLHYGTQGVCPNNGGGTVGDISKSDQYQGAYVASVLTGGANGTCTIRSTFKNAGVNPLLTNETVTLSANMNTTGSVNWDCTSSITGEEARRVVSGECR
ncbi:MAG: pilin [Gammaproteobacteria bacterium]|nr:pilin [Gammaproteobacteria bacterium]